MCLRIREIHWIPHGVSDNVDKCLFVIGNVSGIGCSEAGSRPVATAMRVRGPGSQLPCSQLPCEFEARAAHLFTATSAKVAGRT
jgi:hypothetical protein